MKNVYVIFMIFLAGLCFSYDGMVDKDINNFNILPELEKLDKFEDFESAYSLASKYVGKMNYKVKGLVYAKMSWYVLELTDVKNRAGMTDETLLKGYALGQSYGRKAVENSNSKGYFWIAANMGRWSQVKGMVNSLNNIIVMKKYLDKCLEQNPNYDEVWNLYAHLYSGLYIFGGLSSKDKETGQVIKGNRNHSISCSRKVLAVTDRKEYIPFLYDFAVQLEKRNWDVKKRKSYAKKARLYYEKSEGLPNKMKYYEGVVDFSKSYFWTGGKILGSLSDKQEAYAIYKYCCDLLRTKRVLVPSEARLFNKVLKSLENMN